MKTTMGKQVYLYRVRLYRFIFIITTFAGFLWVARSARQPIGQQIKCTRNQTTVPDDLADSATLPRQLWDPEAIPAALEELDDDESDRIQLLEDTAYAANFTDSNYFGGTCTLPPVEREASTAAKYDWTALDNLLDKAELMYGGVGPGTKSIYWRDSNTHYDSTMRNREILEIQQVCVNKLSRRAKCLFFNNFNVFLLFLSRVSQHFQLQIWSLYGAQSAINYASSQPGSSPLTKPTTTDSTSPCKTASGICSINPPSSTPKAIISLVEH